MYKVILNFIIKAFNWKFTLVACNGSTFANGMQINFHVLNLTGAIKNPSNIRFSSELECCAVCRSGRFFLLNYRIRNNFSQLAGILDGIISHSFVIMGPNYA